MRGASKGFRRYFRRPLGVVGLVLLAVIIVGSVGADVFAPYASRSADLLAPLQSPSRHHIFGTDELGRDVFSEILWGGRTTLTIVTATVLIAASIGVAIGALAGYLGGAVDAVLARLIDGFLVVPQEILAIVVVATLGASKANIVIALTLVFWATTARLVRGEFIALRSRPFVDAARVAGLSRARIIFGELLPSALPLILVNATFLASDAVLAEAGLSFLGLNDPNASSWGKAVFDSLNVVRQAWWTAVFPGIAIVVLVLGLNFAGDAANEVMNARSTKLTFRRGRLTARVAGTIRRSRNQRGLAHNPDTVSSPDGT